MHLGKRTAVPQVWRNTKALGEDQINVVVNAMFAPAISRVPKQLFFEV